MKTRILLILSVVAFSACDRQSTKTSAVGASNETAGEGAGEAIQLKDGYGLALHQKLRQAVDLKLAEVVEAKVSPEFTVGLHVVHGAGVRKISRSSGTGVEANGWLSAENASRIQPGQEVTLKADSPAGEVTERGVVKRLEKSPYAMLGDFEVVVETITPFETGTRLVATFQTPETEAVPVVPRSAVLKTAEGLFVYTVNDNFFLRTPVKAGAMNDQYVEIADGLYAGDQIVASPVNSLWMAELQLLRGGKSCTCGH